jgi:putative molybdopterin biosynthesis protein
MKGVPSNQIRERRCAQGLTQNALAELTELTRQSINAIETGRARPSVDVALRLATALGCSVERLFAEGDDAEMLKVELTGEGEQTRVVVVCVAGRWFATELGADAAHLAADGLVSVRHKQSALVSLMRPRQEVAQNVLLVGCAAGLGVLADRLNSRPGPGRFLWMTGSSTKALDILQRGACHLAGVHLASSLDKQANLPEVKRALKSRSFAVVSLGLWEEGLLVRRRNAGGKCNLDEVVGRGDRLVFREQGSGARRLLDRELEGLGTSAEAVARRQGLVTPTVVPGHLDVGRAIALGFGDAGVASREAADAFGLAFHPLAEERYDMVLPLDFLGDKRTERLFDTLVSAAFRKDLSALGYDTRESGVQIAKVSAAC